MHFNLLHSDRYQIINMFTSAMALATDTCLSNLKIYTITIGLAQTKYVHDIETNSSISLFACVKMNANAAHDILSHTSWIKNSLGPQRMNEGMLISGHKLITDDQRCLHWSTAGTVYTVHIDSKWSFHWDCVAVCETYEKRHTAAETIAWKRRWLFCGRFLSTCPHHTFYRCADDCISSFFFFLFLSSAFEQRIKCAV